MPHLIKGKYQGDGRDEPHLGDKSNDIRMSEQHFTGTHDADSLEIKQLTYFLASKAPHFDLAEVETFCKEYLWLSKKWREENGTSLSLVLQNYESSDEFNIDRKAS